ncbi:F-box/kelch-repeat protein At3g23880 [Coffea arabica]|uniref:F-box/kelch-repeat protein At3g23880 n=1 Tax=Coffea arabica TaxID=13443 RepID=A0ABM4V321_COFAR
METSNSVPSILNGAILDIFCRLPVKSLVRFSAVSKLWERGLFDSNKHSIISMEKSPKTNKNFPLLVCCKKSHKQSCSCHYALFEIERLNKISLFTTPFCLPDNYILAGCCNGILCVHKICNCYNPKKIYLWNPLLHQRRALPKSKSLEHFTDLGFFFDQRNDDYKVVKIFMFRIVEIYSSKSNLWRSVDLTNMPMSVSRTKDFQIPAAFNGILHCLVYKVNCGKDAPPYSVIKFNNVEEKFEEILLPESNPLDFSTARLGVYQGCLSLACWFPPLGDEVWIVKDDQDKGTYKSSKIAVPNSSDGGFQHSDVKGFTINSKDLADCRWDIVLYDYGRGIYEDFGLGSGSGSASSSYGRITL